MEWLFYTAFLVFIGGLVVVTLQAVKGADKSPKDKSNKPKEPNVDGLTAYAHPQRPTREIQSASALWVRPMRSRTAWIGALSS